MISVAALADKLNVPVPGGRWQLFEFADLWIVPDIIQHCAENTRTAQWTTRLCVVQPQSRAELAADAVLDALERAPDIDSAAWTVVDFCSGAGGPVPTIEALVNYGRKVEGTRRIPFRLSDVHPNLDAWMEHAGASDHLSFIPQPVDAANPPFSVISSTTPGDKAAALRQGFESDGSKVLRLFCAAFHRFDDDTAKTVLQSTLQTSDAFAIIELHERRLGSLVGVWLESCWLWLVAVLWFWGDPVHLLLTYGWPVLPAMLLFDGTVSCLRTRTFEEVIRLVDDVHDVPPAGRLPIQHGQTVKRGPWQFGHSRMLHTWPMGYMNVITGWKTEQSL